MNHTFLAQQGIPLPGSVEHNELCRKIEVIRAEDKRRIHNFRFQTREYWLKQQETPRPAWLNWIGLLLTRATNNPLYLPAIDSGKDSVNSEAMRLLHLGARGMPVPPVVARGDGWFLIPGMGTAIRDLLRNPASPESFRQQLMIQAAGALGRLHAGGFWHGKPTLRDMIWDGEQIWYVDFEEDPGAMLSPDQCMVRDCMFMLYSLCRYLDPGDPVLQDALDAYRDAAPVHVWHGAQTLARGMNFSFYVCSTLRRLPIRDIRQTHAMLSLLRRA